MPHPPLPLAEIQKRHKPIRNVNRAYREQLSRLDRFALWITQRVGTIGFFLAIAVWTLLWLGWNLLAPAEYQFDAPMSFTVWLFISNLIQILLMPLIMVGQNLQGRHAEARAEQDFNVNVKAEHEIETILHHLEYQNTLLLKMVKHLGAEGKGEGDYPPSLGSKTSVDT